MRNASTLCAIGIALTLTLTAASCRAKEEPAATTPPSRGVETIASSPHLLVRQVTKPTRAALAHAAFTANPALQGRRPDTETLSKLGEASLKSVKWPDSIFIGSTVADALPVNEGGKPFEPGLDAWAAFNYLKVNDYEDLDQISKALGAVLGEHWGGAAPKSPAQRLAEFIFVRDEPEGEVTGLWAKVVFEPWAKVDSSISDNDGDGLAEFYVKMKTEVIPPDSYEDLSGAYQTEVLSGQDVDDFFEMVLGELYNKIYASIKPRGQIPVLNAAAVEAEEVKAELGTLEITAPDVIVTAKPFGEWIYNVFLIGVKPGAVTGSAGEAAAPGEEDEPVTAVAAAPPAGSMPEVLSPPQTISAREFRADLNARLAALGADRVLQTPDGWLFMDRSLKVLAVDNLDGQKPDPVKVIAKTSERLAAKGIKLIFVPVPSKATVYPERVGGRTTLPSAEPNVAVAAFLANLNAAGVQTFDLLPVFRAAQLQAPDQLLYMKQDTHWTPRGLEAAARALAAEVSKIVSPVSPSPFKAVPVSESFKTDLVSMLPEAVQLKMELTTVEAHQVQDDAGTPIPTDGPGDSPVLVMGDSYTFIFENQHAKSAGFASHLALNLGMRVERLSQQGGGPDVVLELAQKIMGEPDYLAGKKVIIWVMTERDLLNYHGQWVTLPEI